MEDSKPKTLYHYTTMSTLCAVLLNVVHKPEEGADGDDLSYYNINLRATHYKYLNDPTEYKFFIECVVEGLKEYQTAKGVDCHKSDLYGRLLDVIPLLVGDACVVSLSEHRNDLSMWRSYGGDGAGVAIGFNREKLAAKLENCNIKKCKYSSQTEMVKLLTDNGFIESTYKQIDSDGKGSNGIQLLTDVINNAPFCKNDCYGSEREWRIVKHGSDYEFAERAGLIVPYLDVNVSMDCIDEIVIGPCADKELSRYSLQLMLDKKLRSDFSRKLAIETSDIPYVRTK